MKECFIITTYCNTPYRVSELKKCISNLNRFNIDILIHAHYPLDLEIQQSVKYYIYDSTNPVIRDGSKTIIRWKWYKTANKLLTITNPDYSYAVMNQWNSSLIFLKEKKYDYIHVINYDTFITDYVLKKHQDYLQNNDAVFEYSDLNKRDFDANEYDDKMIFVVFFSIKNTFIETLTNELTLEKYLQSKDTMLETYLMEVLYKIENKYKHEKYYGVDNFKIKKLGTSEIKIHLGDSIQYSTDTKKEDFDVYTTVSEANGFDLINIGYCFVFGGINEEHNKFEIFIFEINKPIDNIVININGNITNAYNIKNKEYSLLTDYSMNDIIKLIDEDKVSIIINNKVIDREIIVAMKYQGIKMKYE
jgi:hypothetical protein